MRYRILALALAACGDEIDPPWELDHDRVIAIRATPPRIVSGASATLDALLGRTGGEPPLEVVADEVTVVEPASLTDALARDGDAWRVTAPDAARLDAVRAELALDPGAAVPLRLRSHFTTGKTALKVVWLGEPAENPALTEILVDEVDVTGATELVLPRETDVRLEVPFDDETHDVTWLSSCGEVHDFDLPRAYVRIEPDTSASGTLGVVVRDDRGGVAWRMWPCRAQPAR